MKLSPGLLESVDTNHSDQERNYYEWLRTDIIAVVPETARTILSVGCAAGITEAALMESGRRVVGIEMNSEAAAIARSRGIEIIEGDAANVAPLLGGRTFDCLIYADILEHLPNPEKVLEDHISHLSPGGTIIISIPNFRHWSVLWALFIRGEVCYVQSGIFDRTHVRITTRKSTIRWMSDLNMEVMQFKYLIHARRFRLISMLTLGILNDFLATQILIVAKRLPSM